MNVVWCVLKLPRHSVLFNQFVQFLTNRRAFLLPPLTVQQSLSMFNIPGTVTFGDIFNTTKHHPGTQKWIRLFYQPRSSYHSILHSSFDVRSFTTFVIQQSTQIKDRRGKGETKRSGFCFIFGKAVTQKKTSQKAQEAGRKGWAQVTGAIHSSVVRILEGPSFILALVLIWSEK